jgi:hypothetical protein
MSIMITTVSSSILYKASPARLAHEGGWTENLGVYPDICPVYPDPIEPLKEKSIPKSAGAPSETIERGPRGRSHPFWQTPRAAKGEQRRKVKVFAGLFATGVFPLPLYKTRGGPAVPTITEVSTADASPSSAIPLFLESCDNTGLAGQE